MRDSNYKTVSANKAAITITTSLYDRRALDVTSDKPLVNSLNYLTYLVSSSAKVRETLSVDGGIERLVEILHECHNTTYNISDNIFNSEKKLLTAWKWTLAFQCLVLIGTRGTEEIRQKVVKAGILPIIATVLDNYLTLHERSFAHSKHTGAVVAANDGFHGESADAALMNPADAHEQQHQHQHQPQNQSVTSILQARTQAFSPLPQSNTQPSRSTNPGPDHQANRRNQPDPQASVVIPNHSPTTRDQPSIPEPNSQPVFEFNNVQIPINVATAAIEATSISSNSHSSYFQNNHANNLTSDDYENLTVDQLFKLIRINNVSKVSGLSTINNDVRRRYLIVNIIKKLRQEKELDIVDDRFINDSDYDMDNNLQFLSDLYLQDYDSNTKLINSKIAVRSFTETGVVIPRDDDIVWSLQLLAYISKYPYLKDVLQNTHLVIDMSIRDKQLKLFLEKQTKMTLRKSLELKSRALMSEKSGKINSFLERFKTSASESPQMMNDMSAIHNDNLVLDQDELELCKSTHQPGLTENAEIDDDDDDDDDSEEVYEPDDSDSISNETIENKNLDAAIFSQEISNHCDGMLSKLYDSIIDCESIVDDLLRDIALCQVIERVDRCIDMECKRLAATIISKRQQTKAFLTKKWDYDSYDDFDIDENNADQDDSLIEYKRVNLFPIVEKFTFLSGTDMYYWSGVIMRNSCRRNELRGGVRQCGNLECGKWEKYPREFSKCRRCKRTKYCSRECQIRAWHCHRNWCIPSNGSTSTTTTTTNQNDSTQPNLPPATTLAGEDDGDQGITDSP